MAAVVDGHVGALAGAIVFPLLALPLLGLSRASVAFGLMNLAVAAAQLVVAVVTLAAGLGYPPTPPASVTPTRRGTARR